MQTRIYVAVLRGFLEYVLDIDLKVWMIITVKETT